VTTRAGTGQAQASAADLVVLAGGRFCAVRRGGSEQPRDGWFGWNATFHDVAQPPGSLSMHFHADGYVGVLTFADGSANVCGLSRLRNGHGGSWDAVWDAAQRSLADRVATARRVSPWHGVGPLPFSRRMRRSDGPILAGDAAAVGDPYMGEGISRALGTGGLLCGAVQACGPSFDAARIGREYARRWRRRYTPRLILGSLTRYVQRRPVIFGAVLQQALAHPSAAHLLLRVCHPVAGLTRPGQGGSRPS
jgi:2-polyprenyl-6-methoxyphenol hydroxylase-like FAD-dependent oxidoreductase